MSKIMGTMLGKLGDMFLYKTMSLADLDQVLNIKDDASGRPIFDMLYENSNATIARTASLINAIFTQKLQTFMLSRNYCITLIKNDINHEYSLSNGEYSRLLHYITNSGMFQVLRKPSNKKAGVYKLIQPDFVAELHRLAAKEYFESQEKHVLEFYEKEIESSKKVNLPLADRVREDLKNKNLTYNSARV